MVFSCVSSILAMDDVNGIVVVDINPFPLCLISSPEEDQCVVDMHWFLNMKPHNKGF